MSMRMLKGLKVYQAVRAGGALRSYVSSKDFLIEMSDGAMPIIKITPKLGSNMEVIYTSLLNAVEWTEEPINDVTEIHQESAQNPLSTPRKNQQSKQAQG